MCAIVPRCHAPDLMGHDGTIMNATIMNGTSMNGTIMNGTSMKLLRRTSFYATLLALALVNTTAQEDKQLFHEAVGVYKPKYACERLQSIPLKPLENNIDVLSYEVFLDLYNGLLPLGDKDDTPSTFPATVDMRLVIVSDTLTGVPLHSDVFTIDIDSAFIDGSIATFKRTRGQLHFMTATPLKKNDTVSLRIVYRVSRVVGGGLVVSNGRDLVRDLGSYPIAFTFSEPENSRRWFPCNDVPNDKARFRARARIPAGNRLVSNGELEHTVLDGDSARVETWSSPDIMPPYLFTMNASKFTQLYQLYSRADGTGVPIRNFHWDTDEFGVYQAPYAVRNIPEMFKAFEPLFGRYPFTTYGHVAVHPVAIGGMEHQTMTTVNRKWLEGNAEVGYAHELGHQWLGDAVTCATWGDIWLNEGGATFSEALWREHIEGAAGYRNQMMRRRSKYMEQGQNAPAVWDIPIGNLFNDPTTYAKASWIFHMMRRMLGDELFFTTLQQYLTVYRDKSIQTAEFEAFWKRQIQNPPIAFDVFFDQWLVQRGHPVFWVRLESVKDTNSLVRVFVDQVQIKDGVPDVFHALVAVRFYSNGIVVADRKFAMKERSVNFTIDATLAIDSIEFDPEMLTLHESRTDVTVGVQSDVRSELPSHCLQCPTLRVVGSNPVEAGDDVVLGIGNATTNARLTLYGIHGTEVWTEDVGALQNAAHISGAHLSSGAYVAVLSTRWGTTATRIVVR